MSEELNVVGYLHKNSVGVRILSREATIMARDEGEGWTSTPLVPADELSTLRAQNALLREVLNEYIDEFEGDLTHFNLRYQRARNALAQVAK